MDALSDRHKPRPSFADADPQRLHKLDTYLIAHASPHQSRPAPVKISASRADDRRQKRREKALLEYKQQNFALKARVKALELALSSQLHQLRAVSNSIFDHLSESDNPSHHISIESL
ncbi:hypothetical protein FBU31_003785 [Coemansia sp. 'formosensis']|nr:hypothetical protein FBU31_003785 [Coemansia sp. 'formosensis']